MNPEEYQKAKAELALIEQAEANGEINAESAEYVAHRMKSLRADIFGYEHATDGAYNPYEERLV